MVEPPGLTNNLAKPAVIAAGLSMPRPAANWAQFLCLNALQLDDFAGGQICSAHHAVATDTVNHRDCSFAYVGFK